MKQNGFVLFVVLIFLVIMSLLGTSMFSGVNQQEAMSGSFREKDRAFDAALAPIFYVENWLGKAANVYSAGWNTGTNCTGAAATTPVVCNNPLSSSTSSPTMVATWPFSSTYSLTGSTGGMVKTVADLTSGQSMANTFSTNPSYYIYYVSSTNTVPLTALYQVTVSATGGNADTVAVIQAVFQVQMLARDIGG